MPTGSCPWLSTADAGIGFVLVGRRLTPIKLIVGYLLSNSWPPWLVVL